MKWETDRPARPTPTMPNPGIYECCGGVAAYGHRRGPHMFNRGVMVLLVVGALAIGLIGVVGLS